MVRELQVAWIRHDKPSSLPLLPNSFTHELLSQLVARMEARSAAIREP
jgi:hypothetical protein